MSEFTSFHKKFPKKGGPLSSKNLSKENSNEIGEDSDHDLEMIEILNNRRFTVSLESKKGGQSVPRGNALKMYLNSLPDSSKNKIKQLEGEEGVTFFANFIEE